MKTLQSILFLAIGGLIMNGAIVAYSDLTTGVARIILGVIFFVGVSKAFKEE